MRYYQILAAIPFIISIIIYGTTTNTRFYEMNQIEGTIIQSMSHIMFKLFRAKNALFPVESQYPVSKEYTEFRQYMQLINKFNPLDYNFTPSTILELYNLSNNVLQYLVPIPKTTIITSSYLNMAVDDIPIPIRKNNDYSQYKPAKTRILWLIGDENIDNSTTAKTIIYIHGGYYIFGGTSHIGFASRLSIATATRIAYICYDVPPEVDIPYQVDQVMTVYLYLILVMKIPSNNIVMIGDSAGGGLSLLTIQKLATNRLHELYPSGIIGISPWIDLNGESKSYVENKENDIILDMNILKYIGPYITANDSDNYKNGYYSALYGKAIDILPRMYFIVSKHETLYDDTVQLVKKFRSETDNKVDLRYDAVDYMPHVWILLLDIYPEANQAFDKLVLVIQDFFS